MLDEIKQRFSRIIPSGIDFWSLRLVEETEQRLTVRGGTPEPINNRHSLGAHITVQRGAGIGYGATSDITSAGLQAALDGALEWAATCAPYNLLNPEDLARPQRSGSYCTAPLRPWDSLAHADKFDLLMDTSRALKIADRIIEWRATLGYIRRTTWLFSEAAEIRQQHEFLLPGLTACANRGAETQTRTFGYDNGVQAGLEYLDEIDFTDTARRVAEDALALLDAPECPEGKMQLLLMPEQMMLQIHESVGHPLELDRILGDERNYAGSSFVTLDMFGHYQYGSKLLNITFDPDHKTQISSYGFDDEGTPARREYLIQNGILLRPLGSLTSGKRADLPGLANARASGWNRPAIDRMANLNLEPGSSSLDALVGSIEEGILMDTNRSWSIDDQRNKFQFGCQFARQIVAGELKGIVKNPNYRGISANFWHSLTGVGAGDTVKFTSTPMCGKGEPNQAIMVGHAAPACVFADVDVFGS